MSEREPMLCPKCARVMNCHAEKPTEPRTAAAAVAGVVIEEVHLCRFCGITRSRQVIL